MTSKTTATVPADGQWHELLLRPVQSIDAPLNCEIDITATGVGRVKVPENGNPICVEYTARGESVAARKERE